LNTFQQYFFKNSNIVHAILTEPGLESKFDKMCDELTVFDDTKVQLASAVHPKFKLDWVENQVQKSLLVEQLKRAVEIEVRRRSKTVQQHLHMNHTRISLTLLQSLQ